MLPIERLLNYLRLGVDAEEPQKAMEAISVGVVFRGTNLLILVFAILIASVREAGLKVVSVPIETRYQSEFRLSHFRPVRDVTRITWYTITRIAHYGNVVQAYRDSHATPALVFDPPLNHVAE